MPKRFLINLCIALSASGIAFSEDTLRGASTAPAPTAPTSVGTAPSAPSADIPLTDTPMPSAAATTPPSKDSAAAPLDQGDNNFYWQGTQLYNLGRLGEAFESFEKAIQRKQNSKESEAYLLQIRQEIVNNAKKRAEERSVLKYGDGSPETALNVAYVQKGQTRVTLQMKFLFNENSTSLKTGAIDVLNRLSDMLDVKEGTRVELTVIDELDDYPGVKDVDAERNMIVFAYLNFKRLNPTNNSDS